MPALEAYKRNLDYSYAPGMFPSMEAMTCQHIAAGQGNVAHRIGGSSPAQQEYHQIAVPFFLLQPYFLHSLRCAF